MPSESESGVSTRPPPRIVRQDKTERRDSGASASPRRWTSKTEGRDSGASTSPRRWTSKTEGRDSGASASPTRRPSSRGNFPNPAQAAPEVYEARLDGKGELRRNVPGNFVLQFCSVLPTRSPADVQRFGPGNISSFCLACRAPRSPGPARVSPFCLAFLSPD